MDIRGIEVTNQLRSAIRAKLLELGVRYDEELPDYILVMVVNKKTRQQMHEDLHLFLEDSTTPFVEWLHDQVLKKLQKVTIAKKKVVREFVPMIVVKQEEERKKRKNTIAEDASAVQSALKIGAVVTKEEKPIPKILEKLQSTEKTTPDIPEPLIESSAQSSIRENERTIPVKIIPPEASESIKSTTSVLVRTSEILTEPKIIESRTKATTKRPLGIIDQTSERPEKKLKSPLNQETNERISNDLDKDENEARDEKKLKSCVNKPKITSVVSVKNRLGIISPRKKFEIHRNRDLNIRRRQADKRFEKAQFDANRFDKNPFESMNRRGNAPREEEDNFLRNHGNDHRNRQIGRSNEPRNRLNISREDTRFVKTPETTEKLVVFTSKLRNVEKQAFTVKDRLGTNKNITIDNKQQSTNIEDSPIRNFKNTIKNRLGPIRNNVRATNTHAGFIPAKKRLESRIEDETTNIEAEDDQDDDQSVINVGPVKSHIIAVKRPDIIEKRGVKVVSKVGEESEKDVEEEDEDEGGKSIASKVIVTPRPLKPLQPTQKRATQSLLLRAVAEANKSVVKQKNPEPILSDNKPKLKRLKTVGAREIGKNLSVHLNATKRLVMEKIQVQLRTADTEDNGKSKPYTPQPVNDEHMGVVMSLFQRSDDNQKFLVTLNGYNNNVIKDKTISEEEEERLEMEVTEDDELVLSNVQNNDSYERNESSPASSPIIENEDNEIIDKVIPDENNENHNIENVEIPEEMTQRKRRKLSPIVYNRSKSPSPSENTNKVSVLAAPAKDILDKRPSVEIPLSTVADKSRDKCRYWPNCTVGSKCAYYHPPVPCSAFPACKFGDKCAYKHPNCKFGLSCTKLGCAFSHPKQQCKYHPFCTKPNCPYSHPPPIPVVAADATRAKFTWRRRD